MASNPGVELRHLSKRVLVVDAVESLNAYVNDPDGSPESQMDDVERREYRTHRDRWDGFVWHYCSGRK